MESTLPCKVGVSNLAKRSLSKIRSWVALTSLIRHLPDLRCLFPVSFLPRKCYGLLRPCYDLVTTLTSKMYNIHAVCYDVTTWTPGEPPPSPRRSQTKAWPS